MCPSVKTGGEPAPNMSVAASNTGCCGVRIISAVAMEMEGSARPVMVAETISISYA